MKQATHIIGILTILCLVLLLADSALLAWGEPRKQRLFREIPTPEATTSEKEIAAAFSKDSAEFSSPIPIEPEVELIPPTQGSDPILYQKQLQEFESAKAVRIAQTYYRRSLWESSAEWYLNALEANPNNRVAAEGFVMSAFKAGKYRQAYKIGAELSKTIPGVKSTVVQAASEEVGLLVKQQRFEAATELLSHFPASEPGLAETREILESAMPTNPNSLVGAHAQQATDPNKFPREAQLIRAWSLYHMREYDQAARIFENLYHTQTDKESAKGIVASLRAGGDIARLNRLSSEWGGLLANETQTKTTTTQTILNTHSAPTANGTKQRKEGEPKIRVY